MKKLYLLAAAMLSAATAGAAVGDVTDGWLMLEDFEGTPSPTVFRPGSGEAKGTIEIVNIATEANPDNKAAQFVNGNWESGLQITATLPDGKTIADYKALKVDIYTGNTTYKEMKVYVNGALAYSQGNVIAGKKEVWLTHTHDLELSGTDSEVTIGFYFRSSGNDNYAFDNICLQEKAEVVNPGTYDATRNGTTVDGWFYAQDFQTKQPGDNVAVASPYGGGKGSAVVEVDPSAGTNLMGTFSVSGGDYNTVFSADIRLPEGKTLKDYAKVAFDLYRFEDDADGKQMYIKAADEQIYLDVDEEGEPLYPNQAPVGVWTKKEYTIDESTAVGNMFNLLFGLKTDEGHYAVDNLRFQEREAGPVEPSDYAPTANGTVTDGWLMLQDFQTAQPGDDVKVATPWGSGKGSAAVEVDAKDNTNLMATYTESSGDYNTVFSIDVALPAGKTLKDYSNIAFDLYRYSDDADYKQLYIRAGSEEIYLVDGEYVHHADAGKWTTLTKPIPEATTVGNSFTLLLGIKTDNAHYAVDNIRLEEREGEVEPDTELVDITFETLPGKTQKKVSYILFVNNHKEGIDSYEVALEVKDAAGNTVGTFTGSHSLVADETPAPARALDPKAVTSTHRFSGQVTATGLTASTPYNAVLSVKHNGLAVESLTKSIDDFSTGTTGIEDVAADAAVPEYFTLQGLRVDRPEAGNLYLVRRGAKVTKEFVK